MKILKGYDRLISLRTLIQNRLRENIEKMEQILIPMRVLNYGLRRKRHIDKK
jgi:hypothetical protein